MTTISGGRVEKSRGRRVDDNGDDGVKLPKLPKPPKAPKSEGGKEELSVSCGI